MLTMPVRHSSPSDCLNWIARLRTVCGESATSGFPPENANRPTTGTRPGRKTRALEIACPLPLLSKKPVTQTPLA